MPYNPTNNAKRIQEISDDEFENCDLDEDEIEENPEGSDKFATNKLLTASNQNMSVRQNTQSDMNYSRMDLNQSKIYVNEPKKLGDVQINF